MTLVPGGQGGVSGMYSEAVKVEILKAVTILLTSDIPPQNGRLFVRSRLTTRVRPTQGSDIGCGGCIEVVTGI